MKAEWQNDEPANLTAAERKMLMAQRAEIKNQPEPRNARDDYHAVIKAAMDEAARIGDRIEAATTGKYAIAASLGHASQARAGGVGGAVVCTYWDGTRFRLVVGYVGEDGVLVLVKND